MYSEAVFGSLLFMFECYADLTRLSVFHSSTQVAILCEKLCIGMKGIDEMA